MMHMRNPKATNTYSRVYLLWYVLVYYGSNAKFEVMYIPADEVTLLVAAVRIDRITMFGPKYL